MGIAFLGFTVNGNSGAPVNETQFYEASIIFRGLFVTEDYVVCTVRCTVLAIIAASKPLTNFMYSQLWVNTP